MPALIVIEPVEVFAPERVKVPAPLLVRLMGPVPVPAAIAPVTSPLPLPWKYIYRASYLRYY